MNKEKFSVLVPVCVVLLCYGLLPTTMADDVAVTVANNVADTVTDYVAVDVADVVTDYVAITVANDVADAVTGYVAIDVAIDEPEEPDLDKIAPERLTHCLDLINVTLECPSEAFPLVSLIQDRNLLRDPEDFKTFVNTANQFGVDRTCELVTNYLWCLTNMTSKAAADCSSDIGSGYVQLASFPYFHSRPYLESGTTLCTSYFSELSEQFKCFTNYDLITRIKDCTDKPSKKAFEECLKHEFSKTEGCTANSFDTLRKFLLVQKDALDTYGFII